MVSMNEPLIARFAKIVCRERLPDRMLFSGFLEAPEKKEEQGLIFYFIEIITPWFPNSSVVSSIIKTLEEVYFKQSSLDLALNLENTLRAVNAKLSELLSAGEADWVSKLNGVIGAVKGSELCFSQVGAISGYLLREGKIIQVTENQGLKRTPSPIKVFENLTQGELKAGDRLFIANNHLFNYLSLDRIKQSLGEEGINLAIEEIFHQLKRVKGREANVIALEINTDEAYKKQLPSNCPDVFYLDQPIDSSVDRLKRVVMPVLIKSHQTAKKGIARGKHYGKRSWHFMNTKVRPKLQIIFHNSKKITRNGLSSTKEKLMPTLRAVGTQKPMVKIKSFTVPYYSKSGRFLRRFKRSVKPYLDQLVRFILDPKRRKLIYLLLAIIIIFGVYLKIRSNNDNKVDLKEQESVASAYDEAGKLFDQAKIDLGLKRTEEGMTKLSSALALAEKASGARFNQTASVELKKQIQDEIDKQSKTSRIGSNQLFLELKDAKPVFMAYAKDYLYLSSVEGEILSVNLKTKEQKLVASLPEGSILNALTVSSDDDYVFLLTEKQQLFGLNLTDKSLVEKKISGSAGSFEKSQSIGEFANNVYLLEGVGGIVWKHTGSIDGYNAGKDYLDTRTVSIKSAVSMAIDGEIFILMPDGSIKRFSKGAPQPFDIKNLPATYNQFKKPKQIVSGGANGDLFIVDSEGNRVIRLAKSGDYLNQQITETAINAVAVNQKSLNIWFLSDNKIYESGL